MDQKQYDSLVEQIGTAAAEKIKAMGDALEIKLAAKHAELLKGAITQIEFTAFKDSELKALNDRLLEAEKLTEVVKAQGLEINVLKQHNEDKGGITLEEFLKTQLEEILKVKKAGAGFIEFTSEDMRKAGVTSFSGKVAANTTIGGSVQAMDTTIGSPYMPGLDGTDLELFDIVRNPNFILNRVDVGRTNQSRLAWINETDYQGTPGTNVLEGGTKPLTQHKFKVEFSQAKKAAAHIILSDEFDKDLPQLATAVRRMLQQDVLRQFDDAIQANVIAIARPFEITGLNAAIPFTTLFDAMGALLAQIGFYNFVPNTLGLNSVTMWAAFMDKDAEGRYLNPPFMQRLNGLIVEANKIAVGFGLAGDLTQYKVDIYENFTLRIGWINDQLINNLFTIVGELRYHDYISENRKKAIVYNQLLAVQQKITSGSV